MATVAVQNNHNHQVPAEPVHLYNKPQNAASCSVWKRKFPLGNGKELNQSRVNPPENKSSLCGMPWIDKRTPVERRRARFYASLISAFWERPHVKRWFMLTLTSRNNTENNSESAIKKHFQALVKRWRRRGEFEYMGVIEKGKNGMIHIHVVGYGDYIPQAEISKWWSDIHDAPIVYIESVYHYMRRKGLDFSDLNLAIKLMVGYVTKYLSKQNLSKRVLKSRNFDTVERKIMRMGKRFHMKIVEWKFEKFMMKYGHKAYIVGLKTAIETGKGLFMEALPIEFYFDGIIRYPRGDLTEDLTEEDASFIYELTN